MTIFNHIIGGLVITSTALAAMNENLYERTESIVLCLIASVISDIDNPKGFGRIFYPLSIYIQKKVGHRTLTHSLLFLTFIGLWAGLVGYSWKVVCISMFSHFLIDMITKEGIELFYPFKVQVYLPNNPNWRLQTGKPIHEIGVFLFFAISAYFLQGFIQKGFWTTYNAGFSTLKTTHSEFLKSKDLLRVSYEIQEASESYILNGYLVESLSEKEAIVWDKDKFHIVNGNTQHIKYMTFEHTGTSYKFDKVHFSHITTDSLNMLFLKYKHRIYEAIAFSNNKFKIVRGDLATETKAELSDRPFRDIYIQSLDIEPIKESIYTMPNFEKMKIEKDIENMKLEYEAEYNEYRKKAARQKDIERLLNVTDNYIDRENLIQEHTQLKKELPPQYSAIKEDMLRLQLRISEQRYILDIEKQKTDIEKIYNNEKLKHPPTQISGYIKTLIIE